MKIYTVILKASHENSEYEGYCQKLEAYIDDELCAIQFDEKNHIGSEFNFPVMERLVKAETGGGALLKFSRWQRKGLTTNYLLSEGY